MFWIFIYLLLTDEGELQALTCHYPKGTTWIIFKSKKNIEMIYILNNTDTSQIENTKAGIPKNKKSYRAIF